MIATEQVRTLRLMTSWARGGLTASQFKGDYLAVEFSARGSQFNKLGLLGTVLSEADAEDAENVMFSPRMDYRQSSRWARFVKWLRT